MGNSLNLLHRFAVKSAILWLYFVIFMTPSLSAAQNHQHQSEPLQIAVAANFKACLEEVKEAFEAEGGSPAVLIVGSTGRHFAQIKSGAPFDLFFAADMERPRLLEESGLAVAGTRFTYALGSLVLWAPGVDVSPNTKFDEVLRSSEFYHLAVANPRLAPYGKAARQALENTGCWEGLSDKIVTGQSVGQVWQFVASGAAEAGILALPMVSAAASFTAALPGESKVSPLPSSELFPIPTRWHDPIVQQVVLLEQARNNPAAHDFLNFVKGPVALKVIQGFGYQIPEGQDP